MKCGIWFSLKIHIAFSIAPAKIKISLSPVIFTHGKYIYLKRRINFLYCHGTLKKLKGFGEKIYRTCLWQLKLKEWKGTRT